VRGEEVVSLGWCFWHRSCFGCLLCGSRLDPPPEDELPSIEDDDPNERTGADCGCIEKLDRAGNQRHRGVELDYIPLCSSCEIATEGLYHYEIMEIGLANVTLKDDGLSISRLQMLSKTESLDAGTTRWSKSMLGRTRSRDSSEVWRRTRTLTKGQRHCTCCFHEIKHTASLPADATDIGVGRDGNLDGLSNCGSPTQPLSSSPAPVYLSVLDPIGEPSFQPSKTKPIPSWMALLPKNRDQIIEKNGITSSSPEIWSAVHGRTIVVDNDQQELCPAPDTIVTASGRSSFLWEKNRITSNGPDSVVGSNLEDGTVFEGAISKDGQVELSTCHTSSDYQATHLQRSVTPYPFNKAVYRPSPSLNIPKSFLPRPVTETATQFMAILANDDSLLTLPSQVITPLFSGDEKLKKRYVSGELEPIVGRIKRQKLERATLEGKEKNVSAEAAPQAVQADSVDRREDLRRELMGLFNARRKEPSQK
jgi:hypothetical protein